MMRPRASAKISSKAGITALSDGVRPGTLALMEFSRDVRQRAQMLCVAVRKSDRGDLVAKLFEDFEVGNGNIDAITAFCGKAQARIDNDHLVAKTQQRAVHPKLADATEGNDFEDVTHFDFLCSSIMRGLRRDMNSEV